jgi:hypothetical protein
MVAPAIGHNRTIPNATVRLAPPRSSQTGAVPEERSRAPGARFVAHGGALSTRAMLAALVGLGVVAGGALLLMHALVSPDRVDSARLRDLDLQAAAAAAATRSPTRTAAIPAPTLVAPPSSRTPIANPRAILASPRAVAVTPPSRPGPKPLSQWHSDNPYGEVPATAWMASPRARQASDGPSDNPYGSRP